MSEEGPSGVFQVLDLLGRLDNIKAVLQDTLEDSLQDTLEDTLGIPEGPHDSLGGAAVLGVLSQLEDNLSSLRSQQTASSQSEDSFSRKLENPLSSQSENSFSRKLEIPLSSQLEDHLSSQPVDSLSSQPIASSLTKERKEPVSLIFSPEHEWVKNLVVVICSVLFIILILVVLHCTYRKFLQKYKNPPEGTKRFRTIVSEDTELGETDQEKTIKHV